MGRLRKRKIITKVDGLYFESDKASVSCEITLSHFCFPWVLLLVLLTGVIAMTVPSNAKAESSDAKADTVTAEKEPPSAIDIEIAQAKKEKELATFRKEIAEAEKARRAAALPTTSNKGLEGTVTVKDGAGYYAEVLAYKALDNLSAKLANDIAGKIIKKEVILTDNFELSSQAVHWDIIRSTLDDIHSEFDSIKRDFGDRPESVAAKIKTEGLGAVLTAAPAFLGAVADITKFFRTDREITNRKIELSNWALIASLAQALRIKDESLKIIIPSLQLHTSGELVTSVQKLMQKRREVAAVREQVREGYKKILKDLAPSRTEEKKLTDEIAKLEKGEKDASGKKEELGDLQLKIGRLEDKESEWELIDLRFDTAIKAAKTLVDALTTRPADGVSPLESVAAIDLVKKNTDALILYVEIVSKGAEIETTKRVFRQARISYLGGVVVSYFLFDKDGNHKASGLRPFVETASVKDEREYSNLEDINGD